MELVELHPDTLTSWLFASCWNKTGTDLVVVCIVILSEERICFNLYTKIDNAQLYNYFFLWETNFTRVLSFRKTKFRASERASNKRVSNCTGPGCTTTSQPVYCQGGRKSASLMQISPDALTSQIG